MCGRFTHLYKWRDIHRLSTLTTPELDFAVSYNVAPTQAAPVLRQDERGRRLDLLRWGLIPWWSKDAKIGATLINARAETLPSKPAFRSAFAARRCLVPVSGFYEWRRLDAKAKQPYYLRSAGDDEPLFLAGLWESWKDPEGERLETFTIVTTTPNELVAQLHDRMPAILDPADFGTWLDPKASAEALTALLRPYPAELMLSHPVSRLVNSPRNNGPECVACPPEADQPPLFDAGPSRQP